MKKYLSVILIVFFKISLIGCATYTTMNTNKWLEYELPPSRILKGEVFEGNLSDGSRFSVFFDEKIDVDANYYNAMLRQDFGWQRRDSGVPIFLMEFAMFLQKNHLLKTICRSFSFIPKLPNH